MELDRGHRQPMMRHDVSATNEDLQSIDNLVGDSTVFVCIGKISSPWVLVCA